MHRHQSVRLCALLLSGLLILAACGGGGTSPSGGAATTAPAAGGTAATSVPAASSGQQVTLTWGFWGGPAELATAQKVADAFMQSHPNIKVEFWNQPWDDYFTKLKTLWASGDPKQIPDVLFLWPTPSYAATGVLEDLTPYIQKSNYDLNEYWPALLESAKYQDKVYGLPRDIETQVIYYNKAIFDEAGVPYPKDDWTWDDFLATAKKVSKVSANGRVERYALAAEAGKYSKFVMQNGGTLLDDMRNPSKCTMTDPKTMDAIKFFAGLMNDNLAMRDAALSQAGGDAAVFQSGQAAMILQNSSRVSTFNQAKLNYDVVAAPIPKGGQRANPAGGAAWVMSAKSDNKDAAWEFLSWLQSKDGGEKLYTESGEIFPALQSVAKDVFVKQNTPPANKQAFLTEGEASKVGSFGYFPDWDELANSIMNPGLAKVWAGEQTPEQALPQICQQIDQFLKDKGYPKK